MASDILVRTKFAATHGTWRHTVREDTRYVKTRYVKTHGTWRHTVHEDTRCMKTRTRCMKTHGTWRHTVCEDTRYVRTHGTWRHTVREDTRYVQHTVKESRRCMKTAGGTSSRQHADGTMNTACRRDQDSMQTVPVDQDSMQTVHEDSRRHVAKHTVHFKTAQLLTNHLLTCSHTTAQGVQTEINSKAKITMMITDNNKKKKKNVDVFQKLVFRSLRKITKRKRYIHNTQWSWNDWREACAHTSRCVLPDRLHRVEGKADTTEFFGQQYTLHPRCFTRTVCTVLEGKPDTIDISQGPDTESSTRPHAETSQLSWTVSNANKIRHFGVQFKPTDPAQWCYFYHWPPIQTSFPRMLNKTRKLTPTKKERSFHRKLLCSLVDLTNPALWLHVQ